MNFKKRVNGSWTDIPHYIHNTSTDTLTTLPADLYADGANATATIKGNLSQSGTPSPSSPVYPSETGDKTANLFNKNGEVLTGSGTVINIIATGIRTIVQTAGSNRYSSIKLDDELLGKTITISSTITQSANNKGQIRLFYVNGRYATSMITAITTAGETGHISSTYTMPTSLPSGSDGIAIVLSADKDGNGNIGDYVEYADLMIIAGSTAPTSYIPYGYKIPISSGGTTTPVYLGQVQSTRNIYCMRLLNPSSVTTTSRGYYRLQFSIADHRAPAYTSGGGVCNITTWDGNYDNIGFVANNLTLYITQTISEWETLEGAKTWLNNNPVYVWYILLNAETGIVNEPIRKIGDYADSISNVTQIPTTAGSQTFDVDTTLKPSEVQLAYHGWHEHSDTVFSNP